VKRFDYPQLAEAPFSSIAYSSNRQTCVGMAPSPFPLASAEIFPVGKRRYFAYTFQVANDAMQKDISKALYPLYVKRNCSILRQLSQKIQFAGSNSY